MLVFRAPVTGQPVLSISVGFECGQSLDATVISLGEDSDFSSPILPTDRTFPVL